MINVKSEILPLKGIILHRPGNELLNLTKDNIKNHMFEDIPYLQTARIEHDEFARILKQNGVVVMYLEDLMTDVLNENPYLREKFIKQYVYEAGIKTPKYKDVVIKYLNEFTNNYDLVLKTMEGININELSMMEKDYSHSLVDMVNDESMFVAEPMPNLMYMGGLMTSIGNGISMNKMFYDSRCRESIYLEYIFSYHNDFKDTTKFYDRYENQPLEGGDILVLNSHLVLIGISERTSPEAIEKISMNMFNDRDSSVDTVLAIKIPEYRSTMHLDTVINQVDYDKFIYYPGIIDKLKVYELKKDSMDELRVRESSGNLEDILERHIRRDITMIPLGGGDKVIADREQWSSGNNILCIAPGVVISYDRNNITNAILRRYGVKVYEISSGELSRGRGGPRCLSAPIWRSEK